MTVIADLPGRFRGMTKDVAAKVAHATAFEHAVAICAYASSQYFPNEEIIDEVQKQFLDRVIAFAINARRTLEITDIRQTTIDVARWKSVVPIDDLNIESNLWNALNKIVHSRHLQVFIFERPSTFVTQVGHEWILTYLEIQSDRGDKVHVDPFGMAFTFIDDLTPHFPKEKGSH